jgi:hypothetical protein
MTMGRLFRSWLIFTGIFLIYLVAVTGASGLTGLLP